MDEQEPRRGGGGWIVGGTLFFSFVGVVGWYFVSNSKEPSFSNRGFDVRAISTPKPIASSSYSPPAQPQSGIMIKSDPGLRVLDSGAGVPASRKPASAGAGEDPKASFRDAARRNETTVRAYAEKMTRRYPSVAQYGRDWMSYPDLRKLNDDYMRDHDPAAFMAGLARSPNFGKLVRKYASDPGIRAFVIQGVQQAPGELMSAAGDALRNDTVVKNLVANVGQALGLPSSMMAVINGGQVDQSQVMSEVMNNPQLRAATQGQSR